MIGAQQQRARAEPGAAVARGHARGGEQRDRRPDDDIGPLGPKPGRERDGIEGRRRAPAVGAEPGERESEAIDDAARGAAREGHGDPVAAMREQAHAVGEEVDRRLAVLRREMQPFRRPAGARARQRHHAGDVALRHGEKRRIGAREVGRRGEGEAREVLRRRDLDLQSVAARAIEWARGSGVGDRFAETFGPPGGQRLAGERPGEPHPLSHPSVERVHPTASQAFALAR